MDAYCHDNQNYIMFRYTLRDRTLPEPEGWIYYAGTETASGHDGYMDGAIEAGLRAANEVRNTISIHEHIRFKFL